MGVCGHASGVKQDVIRMMSNAFHALSVCTRYNNSSNQQNCGASQGCAVVKQLLIQLGCERQHVTAGDDWKGTLRVVQGCKKERV